MNSEKSHFEHPANWKQARKLVDFVPSEPRWTMGFELQSLAVFVRDHKQRELPRSERSLEAHYGGFVFSQSCPGTEQARRLALETGYGLAPQAVRIAGREARCHELGPQPETGDPDPRSPAVVVWCDADMFFLVASETLPVDELIRVAESIY